MRDIVIVTPVYNDWPSFGMLVAEISRVSAAHDLKIHMIAVNDGSLQAFQERLPGPNQNIGSVKIVHLMRNLGHQRAIAMGLVVARETYPAFPIVVMDCDGEDQPVDIPRLLEEHDQAPAFIIFAQRARRSESLVFRVFYFFFKSVFSALIGKKITFGNFCIIPSASLDRVVYLQEIWNHFAAGIMHSGMQWMTIPTARGRRYAGKSQMNLVSLVLHGLSAISVYVEVVYVRLLFLSFVVIALDILSFLVLVYIRFFTPLAIPGWATNVAVGLTVVMFQAVLFLALLSFVVLSYRSTKMFIPALDFKDYLLKIENLV